MHPIFAENDDTEAWLNAISGVPDIDAERIQIPDETTWRQWLEYVEIPTEDIDAVIATTPTPESDPDLYRILQQGAAHLIAAMGEIDGPAKFAALKDFNDPASRYFYVQLLTVCLPFVRNYHKSIGVPEIITQATLADLGRNVRVHRKREGVGGLGVMWWLMLHFRGVIFQLGRLQFERQRLGDQIAESINAAGGDVTPDTHALSIHIPDFMGPMDHDACTESIRMATEFFPKYFPAWPVEFGVCNSWLLDPKLKDYLRPESNIIRFQDRFNLIETDGESNDSVMQFVFGKHVADLETVTPRSSLERGVIAHIRNGNNWRFIPGWFRLPTESR